MNLIIRNLLHVLRRFKLAAILNILGLSVAFAAFMIIMMQLKFDFGFDRFHKDSDKIFRLELGSETRGEYQAVISRPLAEDFFASSPHIVVGALSNSWHGNGFFHIDSTDENSQFVAHRLPVTPDFIDVFTFDFVEGSKNALHIPDNIMIPLSLSRKLFGNESAIGQRLVLTNNQNQTLIIGAVYRDFPANSILSNSVYSAIPENENKKGWGNHNYHAYIRVNDISIVPTLFENYKRVATIPTMWGDFSWDKIETNIRLTALPDIHFAADVTYGNAPIANRQTLMILLAIGIIIIIIAAINFTNFSMALTPMRIRNINTQRVMGAQQSTIRWVLVMEAVAFTVISYFVAIILVKAFAGSMLANLVDTDLSFSTNLFIVLGAVAVAVLVGMIAGFYPARYMTSFAPALALKGNFGMSRKGKALRNTLIGVQFVASIALIIGASFMYLQNRFMQNSDLGYNQNALITTDVWKIFGHRDVLVHQLTSHSSIEGVTFAEVLLSSSDKYMGLQRKYNGQNIEFQAIPVHYAFLDVMGISVTEGRSFRQEDVRMEQSVFIFNETARRNYELELSTTIEDAGEIIGFMPDIKFASMRQAVEPMAFFVWGTDNWGTQANQAYIRLKPNANLREAMSHVRTTLKEFDPNFPFEVRFYDEVLQQLYEKETKLGLLISLFSLIAILISIVGVFGLVVFDSECRRKEIGIRKVLGASVLEIIAMFNKTYVKILLICFVIAAPLAWYAMSRWLENFAYRTQLYWWVFLLAFVAVAAITILTVTIQNWRVANDNPVKSIKTE